MKISTTTAYIVLNLLYPVTCGPTWTLYFYKDKCPKGKPGLNNPHILSSSTIEGCEPVTFAASFHDIYAEGIAGNYVAHLYSDQVCTQKVGVITSNGCNIAPGTGVQGVQVFKS